MTQVHTVITAIVIILIILITVTVDILIHLILPEAPIVGQHAFKRYRPSFKQQPSVELPSQKEAPSAKALELEGIQLKGESHGNSLIWLSKNSQPRCSHELQKVKRLLCLMFELSLNKQVFPREL